MALFVVNRPGAHRLRTSGQIRITGFSNSDSWGSYRSRDRRAGGWFVAQELRPLLPTQPSRPLQAGDGRQEGAAGEDTVAAVSLSDCPRGCLPSQVDSKPHKGGGYVQNRRTCEEGGQ